MDKIALLNRIKALYEKKDINIIQWLKSEYHEEENELADILISYDFQAGAYSEQSHNNPGYYERHLRRAAELIDELDGENKSILECGVGEATGLVALLNQIDKPFESQMGLDISWSRVKYGQKYVSETLKRGEVSLVVGDMMCLPCKNNSFDIVFTRHAIEPNKGKEKEILRELFRVTNKYLVLIEPAYELADTESKKRIEEHGYITNLYGSVKELGYHIILWELYGMNETELNPSGIMIIEKKNESESQAEWACPVTKSRLRKTGNAYYSPESLLAYPILNGVPCLTRENAVVATKMDELVR